MTCVAVNAVVDVSADTLMMLVCYCLRVTVRALEHGVVRRIRMARRTDSVRSAVIRREPGMVEYRALPRRRGMARLASCGEAGRRMVRVSRLVVIGLVAAIASRR